MLFERRPKRPVFIAEIGLNHNGSPELAYSLCVDAVSAGASAVKLQFFKASEFMHPSDSDFDRRQDHEIAEDELRWLVHKLEDAQIIWGATPLGLDSLEALARLNPHFIKIASGDLTYASLVEAASGVDKPLILSTGASNLSEITQAVGVARSKGDREPVILHCISLYPTPLHDAKLSFMLTLQAAFPDSVIGISDHSLSADVSFLAAGLGAAVIEKHFTSDTHQEGYDHHMSLDAGALRDHIAAVNLAKSILGAPDDERPAHEVRRRTTSRRGLYWARSLPKGHRVTLEDVVALRPNINLSVADVDSVVGKALSVSVEQLEAVTSGVLSPDQ